MKGKVWTRIALLLALTAIPLGVVRAQTWPERPITIVVCFAAGGGTDILVRMVSDDLAKALGRPVIIENRGGASGNIAINAVTRAAPDGYTLLACSSAVVVNPSLYAQAQYDPLKDLAPIMVFAAAPNIFVVPGTSPAKDFAGFVEQAKAAKGKTNWTTPGQGTTPYMVGELMKMRLGIEMTHIPFAGAGPATQAALAGQVDLYGASIGSVRQTIASGSLRGIVQTGKERWPDLQDVPTLADIGIKDAESDTFFGLFAPGGTPDPIVQRIAKELGIILARKDVQERYLKAGVVATAEGPDTFKARIRHEVPFYREIIRRIGLQIR